MCKFKTYNEHITFMALLLLYVFCSYSVIVWVRVGGVRHKFLLSHHASKDIVRYDKWKGKKKKNPTGMI